MAINLGILEMLLRLRDELTPQLGVVQRSLDQAGSKMRGAGMALLPLSAGLAAVGFGAAKMATDLNASIANVSALLTNLSGSQLDATTSTMKTTVQAMAIEMGKSTDDLAGGLYEVISALGFTEDTFGQLEIAAKAGAAGLATTQESFNFLSAVTKTYGDTSEAAFKKAADLGFQAVNFGQTTFPELAASIGGVAPIAKVAGVSMEEMFAVIATATGVTGNTSEVVTQMTSAINALLNPSDKMEELFAKLGVTTGQALIQQRGFVGALQAVAQFAEATKTPMLEMLGRKEAFILTASLAGSQAQNFGLRLEDMGQAAAAAGGVVEAAFEKQTQGVNKAGFAWQQFKAEMQVTMQQLGDVLLPILLRAAEQMRPVWQAAMDAVKWFGQLPEPVQTGAVAFAALIVALAPVLLVLGTMATSISALIALWPVFVAGMIAATYASTAFWVALTGPIGLTVLAITAVTAAFVIWGRDLEQILRNFGLAAREWLVYKFQEIVNSIKGKIDAVIGFFRWMKDTVVSNSIVPDMVDGVLHEFVRMHDGVLVVTETLTTRVTASFRDLATVMQASLAPAITDAKASLGAYDLIAINSVETAGRLAQAAREDDAELRRMGFALDFTAHAANNASQQVQQAEGVFSSFVGKLKGNIESIWQGMTGGKGLGGILTNLGGGIIEGFGNIISGGLSGLISKGVGLLTGGLGKLFGGLFGKSEGRKQLEEANAQIQALQAQLLATHGSIEQIVAIGGEAGQALADAWGSQNREGLAWITQLADEFNATLAEQTKIHQDNARAAEEAARIASGSFVTITGELNILQARIANTDAIQRFQGAMTDAAKTGQFNIGGVISIFGTLRESIGSQNPQILALEQALVHYGQTGVLETDKINAALKILGLEYGTLAGIMSKGITIPVTVAFQDVNLSRASERAEAAGMSAAQARASIGSFLERNVGDVHRITSALGFTAERVRELGFQHGTQGRFVDFGPGTLAMLHGRERIVTEREARTEASGNRRVEQHIHIHIDGYEAARAILPHWTRALSHHGLA